MDADLVLMRIRVSLPFTISDREFVTCQWSDRQSGGPAKVVSVSLPESLATTLCGDSGKRVRGEITTQCTFITPHAADPSVCSIKWISCVDPGGEGLMP